MTESIALLQSASPPLDGAPLLLLALLFAGHTAADMAFQTRAMIDRKRKAGGLLLHGACVLVAHAVAVVPVLSGRVVVGVLVITLTHLLIDLGKSGVARRVAGQPRAALWLFLVDQLLHAAVIWLVWLWLIQSPVTPAEWVVDIETWTRVGWWVTAYSFTANGAGSIIALILDALPRTVSDPGETPDADATPLDAVGGAGRGRLIGILERWLILTLLLVGQWGVIGFILAAKSIARFDELKKQDFAEYYLIGTLLSVLFAIGTGLLLMLG